MSAALTCAGLDLVRAVEDDESDDDDEDDEVLREQQVAFNVLQSISRRLLWVISEKAGCC